MRHLMSTLMTSSLLTLSGVEANIQASEKVWLWTPKEMMRMKVISDVQLSPNNEAILFVVTEAKMTADKSASVSRIHKSTLDGKKSSTPFSLADSSATQPRWSPDGQWIAFLSNRDGVKNLYLIGSAGGEATALTKSKKDVQTFSWSPNSQKIAFVMADEREQEKKRDKTSAAYQYQQETTINRLWLIDVFSNAPTPKALTSDDCSVRGMGDFGTINTEYDWSPDSKTIAFAYSPAAGFDYFHLDSSIATVNISTGDIALWEKKALYEALPRYSPDGQWIAYVSSNSSKRYAFNRQVALRSKEGKNEQLLAPTFNEGPFLSGPSLLGWTQDGKSLLFFEPKGTKFHIVSLPIDGSPAKELESGGCFFKDPVLSYDRTMLGLVVQSPNSPPEACVTKLDSFKPLQASALNQALLSYPQTKTDVIGWESKDGLRIEGLLTYPLNYQEGKSYPLLLVVHGGPMAFFDETFLGTPNPYPLASFAEAGFLIFRPNPRGSCGYGKSFRCANYADWGGMDFIDMMTGVDALIAKAIADPTRLGIMGWSYGGYMTAWTVTQTSRFKAASIGAGLCNLVSMAGTTDLHRLLIDYLGDFTDNPKLYEKRSPIHHVLNVTTPCLIQHGTEDKRVPPSQAYEFYHALNRTGKQASLILYPGMEHRISDPKMQLDAMERNLAWFQKLL